MPRDSVRVGEPEERNGHPVRKEQEAAVVASGHDRRITVAALRQHARLAIGVGGVTGGVTLLAANIVGIVAGGGAFSPIPVLANVALIFGGIMFLRERRRSARLEREQSTRDLASG